MLRVRRKNTNVPNTTEGDGGNEWHQIRGYTKKTLGSGFSDWEKISYKDEQRIFPIFSYFDIRHFYVSRRTATHVRALGPSTYFWGNPFASTFGFKYGARYAAWFHIHDPTPRAQTLLGNGIVRRNDSSLQQIAFGCVTRVVVNGPLVVEIRAVLLRVVIVVAQNVDQVVDRRIEAGRPYGIDAYTRGAVIYENPIEMVPFRKVFCSIQWTKFWYKKALDDT
uniref:Uncharacterized protein n=1 Tax=Romanomermis culicivorax TaxID=13658 RepID=A0A915JNM4_ROMCU